MTPEQNRATDEPEENASPDAGRILIVDDDPDFLAVAEASLSALGFRVERASGGLRGVFLATQDVPDAIICDLRMPGIDGFVVAEALRADPATEHTVIVACTGRRDLEARAQVRSSAFDAVLIKPVDWEEVARLLADAIAARRTRAGA
ncbi:twitching motility protein PilH [Minicystis rosea]|nr:twitching motility protein PilH [Minicystis rosea]